MTAARDRKEASKRLGIALQAQYRALLEAEGESAVQGAAIILGSTFNTNIEFIFWVLKEYGGVQQMPIERQHRAANDEPKNSMLPPVPTIFAAGRDVDRRGKK